MNKNSLGVWLIVLAVLAGLTGLSCTKKENAPKEAAPKPAPALVEQKAKQAQEIKKGVEESKNIVVAKVNGAPITMYQLVSEMNLIAPRYTGPERKRAEGPGPGIDKKIKKEALDRLIFKKLALQEAMREGIHIKPEIIEDVVKKIRENLGSDAAYKEYLTSRGVTENGLKEKIEESRRFEMITAKEIYQKISPDDAMLRAEYEKNKQYYMTGAPPRQMSFEEARPVVERQLKAELGEKKRAEWEKEL